MNSRLNMALREKHGFVYSIGAQFVPFTDTGLFVISFGTEPTQLKRSIELVKLELKKLQGWLEKIRKLDFYGGGLAVDAAERLKGCEALLDAYAQRVFEAHDENR